jgi:hypothetical protein
MTSLLFDPQYTLSMRHFWLMHYSRPEQPPIHRRGCGGTRLTGNLLLRPWVPTRAGLPTQTRDLGKAGAEAFG